MVDNGNIPKDSIPPVSPSQPQSAPRASITPTPPSDAPPAEATADTEPAATPPTPPAPAVTPEEAPLIVEVRHGGTGKGVRVTQLGEVKTRKIDGNDEAPPPPSDPKNEGP